MTKMLIPNGKELRGERISESSCGWVDVPYFAKGMKFNLISSPDRACRSVEENDSRLFGRRHRVCVDCKLTTVLGDFM